MNVVSIHTVVNVSFSELCVLKHLGYWKLLGAGAWYSRFGAMPCRGGDIGLGFSGGEWEEGGWKWLDVCHPPGYCVSRKVVQTHS